MPAVAQQCDPGIAGSVAVAAGEISRLVLRMLVLPSTVSVLSSLPIAPLSFPHLSAPLPSQSFSRHCSQDRQPPSLLGRCQVYCIWWAYSCTYMSSNLSETPLFERGYYG